MNHGLPPFNWDASLLKQEGSFLQSRPWALVQQALGRELYWARAADGSWQWLAGSWGSKGLRYLHCAYGPTASAAGMAAAIASLQQVGRSAGADFVRLEPQRAMQAADLQRLGAREITEADPKYTRVVDLELPLEQLRTELASSHRNNINGTERRGITIRQSSGQADLESFLAMLRDTAARAKVSFYPDSYYRTLVEVLAPAGVGKLYVAEAGGEPVAAALFYDWGGTRYYAHAGAFQDKNRKLRANVSLVWQALLDAKQAGLRRFDLWGVAPEGDARHHLAGLSGFKQGFGGQQIDYLGTWDLPIKPGKYRLYGAYRKLRGWH